MRSIEEMISVLVWPGFKDKKDGKTNGYLALGSGLATVLPKCA